MQTDRTFKCLLIAAMLLAAPAFGQQKKPKTPKINLDGQYKKFPRDMLTHIAQEDYAPVFAWCKAYLEADPKDLESHYLLALAYARTGEIDKAMDCAAKGVELGLPIGRFLAGPRNVAKPLVESPAFKALLAKHPVQLIHGPLLGSMTDTSVRVWVRTAAEADMQVVALPDRSDLTMIKSPVVRTRAAVDFTAVLEVSGLTPDRSYCYQVSIDGKPVKIDPSPTFRTFPAAGQKANFKLVFGGGAGYTPKYEHMWNTLTAEGPLAFLTLGDNVYIDTPAVPEAQQYCYYRRQSRPEYRRFTASVPSFAIWDDHDFGVNDCKGSAGIDDIPWKIPVWNVFRQNWANPSYGGGRKQPGVWFTASIGDVDFFFLDCRYYRVRNKDGSGTPTMLGPVQKKWFLKELAASKGAFKVLASSVPWTAGVKGSSKDTWDGFPAEREEIYRHIEKNRIEGVFLISADRHRSDAYKTAREKGYPLYEASSSKLTNIHTHELIKHALFGYNEKCSYGRLTFDTTKGDPTLTYDVINIDGELIHTLKVKRSELGFK